MIEAHCVYNTEQWLLLVKRMKSHQHIRTIFSSELFKVPRTRVVCPMNINKGSRGILSDTIRYYNSFLCSRFNGNLFIEMERDKSSVVVSTLWWVGNFAHYYTIYTKPIDLKSYASWKCPREKIDNVFSWWRFFFHAAPIARCCSFARELAKCMQNDRRVNRREWTVSSIELIFYHIYILFVPPRNNRLTSWEVRNEFVIKSTRLETNHIAVHRGVLVKQFFRNKVTLKPTRVPKNKTKSIRCGRTWRRVMVGWTEDFTGGSEFENQRENKI